MLNVIPNKFDEEEKISMSFGLTALLIGVGYITSYLASSSIKSVFPQAVLCLAGLLLLYLGIRGRKSEENKGKSVDVYLLAVFLAQYLLKISLQSLIPFYPMGADYYEQYERVRFFLYIHEKDPYKIMFPWWHVPDRTPLFNIIGVFFFAFFRDRYWILQVVSCLFNSILILPGYLIAKKMFDRKTATLTVLLLSMNPFLTENALYTWPKNLAAYFCLLSLYFLMFHKNLFYAGSFAALGYLSHQYSIWYIVAGMGHLLFKGRKDRNSIFKELMTFLLSFCLLVSPWFFWKGYTYGLTYETKFLYYPFAVHGVLQVVTRSAEEILSEFLATPISTIAWIRVENALETLIPFSLFSWPISKAAVSEYYFHTIPGGLTLAPLFFALRGLWKNRGALKRVDLFFSIPFLGTLILYGWFFGAGLARQTLQPVIVLLVIFAARGLSETGRRIFILSYLMETIEFCLFIWWIHIYDLYLLQEVYTPGFVRDLMLAWDLVDPNQLFFILPAIALQLFLIILIVFVGNRISRRRLSSSSISAP